MIAFFIKEIDVRGGTHKQLLRLLDYATSKAVKFVVITRSVDYDKTYPGFKKYDKVIKVLDYNRKGNKLSRWLRNAMAMRRMIRDVDVINIHDNGFERFFLCFLGKKVYWQVNDLPDCFKFGVSKGKSTFKELLHRIFIRATIFTIDEIIVNVSKNKNRIYKTFHRKAHVFHCGIDKINVNRIVPETFDRFKNRKINILSSGVFFPYRNYETQIKVIEKLRGMGIDANLKIIGAIDCDQAYTHKIQSLIEGAKLQGEIIICGQVDGQAFCKLHSWADVFIFINIDQSWGLAVFEAMSCGLPVIVSNSVGATEILSDKCNAIFVDPTDVEAITASTLNLMQNESLYEMLSENAIKFCDSYTWDSSYSSKMLELMAQHNVWSISKEIKSEV